MLAPGERRLVPTGIAIAVPAGYAAFVHPRSGLAARHGLSIVNTPGTVDAGYRGEIKVCLVNTDAHQSVSFSRGDRIAQLVDPAGQPGRVRSRVTIAGLGARQGRARVDGRNPESLCRARQQQP